MIKPAKMDFIRLDENETGGMMIRDEVDTWNLRS